MGGLGKGSDGKGEGREGENMGREGGKRGGSSHAFCFSNLGSSVYTLVLPSPNSTIWYKYKYQKYNGKFWKSDYLRIKNFD